HTMVLDIGADGAVSVLAATMDDSFGESFDKVAKMLGLGYPGGVAVEKAAKIGRERFKFTVPLLGDARTAYSFSGLKNQVRVETEKLAASGNLGAQEIADICFAFENTACKHILNKLEKIFAQRKFERFGVVGGASANLNLRSRLKALCDKYGCELICAPLEFCSDNAAMIARAGREKYLHGEFAGLDLQASPRSELTRI
ncbi:UGMP family protein, partial [Campylobacter showae CC57C]